MIALLSPARLFAWIVTLVCAWPAIAQSWPTYRHDNRRSGVTDESLHFPLDQLWLRRSEQPPQAAWTGPAKWDAWAGNSGLQSMRNFDPCFYVTVVKDRLYFGSSVDDAVHCLEATSGKEIWTFFTAAPVRFPPTIADGLAYFGSDDGYVYCCDAETGKLVWKKLAAPENRRITSNRKIISLWPVRTGVLVHHGRACFASSLVPWETSLLWNVDAQTGSESEPQCYRREVSGVTLQGAMLASSDRIYVPQGRAPPLAFDLGSGKPLGAFGEAGGVFCVLTEDEMLLAGPQHQKEASDQIRLADGQSKKRLASLSGTNRILVSGQNAWVPVGGKLKMLDRSLYVAAQAEMDVATKELKRLRESKQPTEAVQQQLAAAKKKSQSAWRWEVDCPHPSGFIKAGDVLLIGSKNEVRAHWSIDGKFIWKTQVDGTAHGLAVAQGKLFVSTGLGHIYAFGSSKGRE